MNCPRQARQTVPQAFALIELPVLIAIIAVVFSCATSVVAGEFSAPITVEEPKFVPERGFYTTPFEAKLTAQLPRANIRYTTNGSVPSLTNGITYSAPLRITGTTTLRAAAFKQGGQPSATVTHTYLFFSDIAQQDFATAIRFGFPPAWASVAADYGFDQKVVGSNHTDLYGGKYAARLTKALASVPTLSLVTDLNNLFGRDGLYIQPEKHGREYERPVSIELIFPDGRRGFQIDAGLRIQGGFFRQHSVTPKHSFRLLFRETYGSKKLRFPLFGSSVPTEFDTLTLRAGANDAWQWEHVYGKALYIRDLFVRQTLIDMGGVAARGLFVHLYLNGMYWGLYEIAERPDASFAAAHFGGKKREWDSINDNGAAPATREAWDKMMALCESGLANDSAFQKIQGKNPDGSRNPKYEPLLDVGSLIDYMIVNIYCGTGDWPARNFWVARRRVNGTGFKFFPWDAEMTLGLMRDVNANIVDSKFDVALPYAAARANAEFRLEFGDHVHRHFFNGGALCVDTDTAKTDSAYPGRNVPADRFALLAQQIEHAIVAESARWGDQHARIPYTRDEQWALERKRVLEELLTRRSAVVLNQFRAAGLYPNVEAPSFNRHGGAVPRGLFLRMAAPSGTIHYTLDGSDPRKSATATAYRSDVVIEASTMVKARVRNDNVWSALNEASFAIVDTEHANSTNR